MKRSLSIEGEFSLNKQDPYEPIGIEFRYFGESALTHDPKRDLADILEEHMDVPNDSYDEGLVKKLRITVEEL